MHSKSPGLSLKLDWSWISLHTDLISTDMSGKVILVLALLVALLVSGEASSLREAKDTNGLRQLLDKRGKVRGSIGRQELALGRTQRRTHLSEDEREIMTKQIMQAISELMNSDCMLDRDYQGWVDFGRRDVE